MRAAFEAKEVLAAEGYEDTAAFAALVAALAELRGLVEGE